MALLGVPLLNIQENISFIIAVPAVSGGDNYFVLFPNLETFYYICIESNTAAL